MGFDDLVQLVYRKDLAELARRRADGADFLVLDRDGRTLLMHAVLDSEAQAEMVRWLVANGVPVGAADAREQYTALHFAARDQKRSLVEVLIEVGAKVDAQDAFGNTPLWRAVMKHRGDLDLIRLLLSKGADPDIENKSGVSPRKLSETLGKQGVLSLFSPRDA